jgi:TPP-dependent pyruvate/acetoin dehydrogenase alpha subunit
MLDATLPSGNHPVPKQKEPAVDGTPMAEAVGVGAMREPSFLLQLYRRMVTIRRTEETLVRLFAEGRLPGFIHSYAGEEATVVGVCAALSRDDYITSTHRGHGHILAKGGDLNRLMAEVFGPRTGYCGGKGGSSLDDQPGLKSDLKRRG